MGKIAFILSLGLLTFAWADDYDDFEKSLMGGSSEAAAENENASADSSTDAFEQSLMTPSDYADMEPVYKLRETLLENIKHKDTAKVSSNIRELEAMQTKECLPILEVEKKFIYLDLKMYRQLIPHLVQEYRTAYDTLEVDAGYKVAKDDGLHLYVKNTVLNLDTSSADLYSRYSISIRQSRIKEEEKDELEILMKLDGAYWNEKNLEKMRGLVERFVNQYPNNPDVEWLQKAVLLPMQRIDTFSMYMDDRAKNKEKVIQDKLYTGGLGFNLYLLGGGVASGYDNLYRKDLEEASVNPVHLEFYLQFKRFALLIGYFNTALNGIETLDWDLGFVLYDSRYFKFRPFIGASTPFGNFSTINSYSRGSDKPSDHSWSVNDDDSSMGDEMTGFVVGANFDFKFGTTYFLLSDSKLTSFSLVGRVGISNMSIDCDVAKGDGYMVFFSLGLGIYLW